jgi:ribonuclease HII
MFIAGIDEAGRGPALGPMVIAIAVIEKEKEEFLKQINVKDSKELTANQREKIYEKLKKNLNEINFIKIQPAELDKLMTRKSLNEIEAMKIALLIDNLNLKPSLIIIDCPDTLTEKFILRLKKYLSKDVQIKAEHKADKNHLIVGAASIIAKVERDKEIMELSKKFGDIGSGYSHDPITIAFIENYIKKHGSLPDFARKEWITNERILNKRYQRNISDY